MEFLLLSLLLSFPANSNGIQWLALSRFSSVATVNPPAMCEKMRGSLIRKQIKFCKKNPNFMDSVRIGAVRAIDECQYQFRTRRWNCSTLGESVKQDFNELRRRLNEYDMKNGPNLYDRNGFSLPNNVNGGYEAFNSAVRRMRDDQSSRGMRNVRRGRRLSRRARQGTELFSNGFPEDDDDEGVTNDTSELSKSPSANSTLYIVPQDKKSSPDSSGLPQKKKSISSLIKAQKRRKNKRRGEDKLWIPPKYAVGPYPVVSPGTREMAFVHAISSAGVAHALTRACSSGELENCGCDRSLRGMSPKGFQWSGCSDNVDFGITFSRTFVDARDRRKSRKRPGKAQPLMNLHNNEAGRKLLERNMKIECKCHGVSGSCELKTCWRSVASFRVIGEILKEKFDSAHEVTQKKRRGRRMLLPRYQKFKPHTDTDLVYLKTSPDYCEFDVQKGSLGTHGRECDPESKGVNGCDIMCCNRGYTTRKEKRVERCKCKFHWCCYVECEECFREVLVSTCN